MMEMQSMFAMMKRARTQRALMFKIASVWTPLFLCACQTTSLAGGDQAGPPPAFRKEAAERVLAFQAGRPKGAFFSPFRIAKAWLSTPEYSAGESFYCVSFAGTKGGEVGGAFVWYSSDDKGNRHITGVSTGNQEEEVQFCGTYTPIPEVVGRIYK